jgi:mannitol/fructose-specific phosphotransferase system IIA component
MNASLPRDGIRLGLRASDRFDAVTQSGRVLVEIGAVEPPYVDAMLERERHLSTALGEGFAIPHGTEDSRRWIRQTMLGFLQFPDGIPWDDDIVFVCVGIAAVGDEHVSVLASLARVLMVPEHAAQLRSAGRVEDVLELLGSGEEVKG